MAETLYRCTECGTVKENIGSLHAHAERHRRWGPLNLLPKLPGNVNELMDYTEEIKPANTVR